MPIVVDGPPVVTDEVIDTQSPFWLRVNGVWVQIPGVTPGSSLTLDRPRSELVTVDGYRYAQQAPRAAREWSLSWQYATPAAVAAVQLAAEAPGDVWLYDGASAVANMLDPRLCYGHDSIAGVIDCGGVPLRAIETSGFAVDAGEAMVRGGVQYAFALWSTKTAGVKVATLTYPGGTLDVPSAGPGVRAEVTFAPSADGDLIVEVFGWAVTGLQVVEGDLPPTWLAGERTPCKVAVADPARTLNLLPSGRRGRSEYAVALREVG